ncbi:phosphoribosylanthranilate isomerase [Methyloversatilis sp.]|uniref:phosphoribosylanthranilate isomerase n=1 Tax=Methyloversatilis sp. TaxID=2569862 RepID=UPI0027362E1C|nr:phosphoribosylanthranilate isomerase [Methyloversatilis sp.]MDP2869621.1 phosphoribosylanthranilate isomerase [Methyloversatilis sp.]MDP3454591.1 phosphoribosylanthranilate isomerase [Methyloversatilis sp.]MDP3580199.1 phosphoribosylanthranilate isomerase [Methyloversatilis sp.]
MVRRTRIKVCGFTREFDLSGALALGVDAVGFVLYPPSPRAVTLERAAALALLVPPFVTRVGLFVNEDAGLIGEAAREACLDCLQFHGDETPDDCERFGLPYIKAVRVRPGLDLLECAVRFRSARALLLDAYSEGWGGSGKCFDWTLIPHELPLPVILSGGLDPETVSDAVRRVAPAAVDVSSGVESAKGIKDVARVAAFISGVENGEARPAG